MRESTSYTPQLTTRSSGSEEEVAGTAYCQERRALRGELYCAAGQTGETGRHGFGSAMSSVQGDALRQCKVFVAWLGEVGRCI